MSESSLCGAGLQTWRTSDRCCGARGSGVDGRVRCLSQPGAGSSRWGIVCGVPTGAIGVKLGAGLTNRNHVNTGTIRVLPFPHPGQGCGG